MKGETMQTILRFLMVLGAVITLLTLTTGTVFAQDPDNGKLLWEEQVKQCQRCHGQAGEGAWAGPLAGSDKDAEAWITQVRTPRKRMPGFSPEQVSDEAIVDMQAYLASLPKPDGFTPPDAGLPDNAPAGQTLLVEKKCVACHGINGPIDGFTKRGETPTAERVIAQLRTPFKAMPSFNTEQVSDAEAGLIADFLVSQMPPPSLPQSGGNSTNMVAVLLLVGGGLVVFGATLRRLVVKR
jgi:mono/diheme cytochrome c family protein